MRKKAQPTSSSFKKVFDDEFVLALLNTTEDWREDKLGIFIEIKNYSSSYANISEALKGFLLYQEFYDFVLVHLLQCNFDEAVRRVSKTDNATVFRIKEIENFIKTCFSSFVNDSLYNQVPEMNNQLKSCTEQVERLTEQQNEFFRKLKDAELQQKTMLVTLEEASEKIKDADEKLKSANTNLESANNKLESDLKKAEEEIRAQTHKVTETSTSVLGIFVSVVMVFFGGFTILENAISGIGVLSVYRLSFTMLLFGLILFNIVVLLFYLISRMTGKTVACQCSKNSNNKCSECTYCKRFKFICRFENTMPYVYWGNAAILFCLLFVFLLKSFANGGAAAPEFFSQTLPASLCTGGILLLFTVIQHFALGRK